MILRHEHLFNASEFRGKSAKTASESRKRFHLLSTKNNRGTHLVEILLTQFFLVVTSTGYLERFSSSVDVLPYLNSFTQLSTVVNTVTDAP